MDSVLFLRQIYESNEYGQTAAYTEYYLDQAETDWLPGERQEFIFDIYGRTDSVKSLQPDGPDAWKDYWLRSYTYGISDIPKTTVNFRWDTNDNRIGLDSSCQEYDLYGGQTLLETYTWGMTTENWYPQGKQTWVRDPDGLILESLGYIWGIDSTWHTADKVEYFYDESRLDTLRKDYGWNDVDNVWKLLGKFRSERDFNAYGEVTECRTFNYDLDQGTWLTWGKTIFTYASEGDTVYEEGFHWNNDEWQFVSKRNTIVDNEQRLLYHESYTWNYNMQKFIGLAKYIQAYDDSGEMIYYEHYAWDWEKDAWAATSVYTWRYTQDGNKIFEKHYIWDLGSNDWAIDEAYYYYYTNLEDIDAPQISVLEDSLVKGEPIIMVCSQDAWVYLVPEGTGPGDDLDQVQTGKNELAGMTQGELSTSSVQYAGLHLLYAVNSSGMVSRASRVWIDFTEDIQFPPANLQIRIYPTLVDQYIHIQSEQPVHSVEIFDLQGRLMKKTEGSWQVLTLDLSWLDAGLYLIRCDQDSGTSTLISKQ